MGQSGKPLHYKGSMFHRVIKEFMLQASGSPAALLPLRTRPAWLMTLSKAASAGSTSMWHEPQRCRSACLSSQTVVRVLCLLQGGDFTQGDGTCVRAVSSVCWGCNVNVACTAVPTCKHGNCTRQEQRPSVPAHGPAAASLPASCRGSVSQPCNNCCSAQPLMHVICS